MGSQPVAALKPFPQQLFPLEPEVISGKKNFFCKFQKKKKKFNENQKKIIQSGKKIQKKKNFYQ
jgi:hypothetical protein